MKKAIRDKMDGIIEKDLNEIESMDAGTRERAQAVTDVTELYETRLEEEKNRDAARGTVIGHLTNFAGEVVKTVVPVVAMGIMYVAGLEFEKSGNIPTSYFVKQVVSKPFRR